MRALTYNDSAADRNSVAIVQAIEAMLAHAWSQRRRNPGPSCRSTTPKAAWSSARRGEPESHRASTQRPEFSHGRETPRQSAAST